MSSTPPLHRFISWGDNDTTSDAEAVLDRIMMEPGAPWYLFAGDGPYSEDASDWIDMMESYFPLGSQKKAWLFLSQGNHEHPESESQTAENQIEDWMPGLNNPDDNLDWLQSRKIGNVFVIIMNSQDPQLNTVGGDQYNWVRDRLAEAKTMRAAGQIDWIITVIHKQWFSVNSNNTAGTTARMRYDSLFRDAGVDFMFHGHSHTYQIFKPIVPDPNNNAEDSGSLLLGTLTQDGKWDFTKPHGTIYVINGNGGHEINGFGEDPNSISTLSYGNDEDFGYSVLDIQGRQATLRAKDVNGNVLHTVLVTRGTDTTTPPPTTTPPLWVFNRKWGSNGTGNGQFRQMEGIAVDNAGNIYVSDWVRHDVQKFSPTGTFIRRYGGTVGVASSSNGQFNTPWGIAFDPQDGHMWVADQFNHRIQKINRDTGAHMLTIGPTITGLTNPTTLNEPEDIAFDPVDFSMYINDQHNSRIVKVDSSGNFVTKWQPFAQGYPEEYPEGMVVNPVSRNVYVTAYFTPRIYVFSPTGQPLFDFGRPEGVDPGEFTLPMERCAVDKDGRFYQLNGNPLPKVFVFSSTGTLLSEFGSGPGSADGQLSDAEWLAVDNNYDVYIVDQNNYRVSVFRLVATTPPTQPPPTTPPPTTPPPTGGGTTAGSILMPADLKFYFSGGYYNSEPNLSLGGETSSFALQSGALNGLFDRVDTAEAETGDQEYRCVYLRNTSQTRKLLGARIWIETGTASADTSIAISIGSSGINGTEPLLPDEGLAPPMQFFEIPLNMPDEPNIGDLYPGDHIGLWIRWQVKTGTQTITDDFAVIRIDGEREVESQNNPLPPGGGTDPPITGCPPGSKWDPTSAQCVDDSTVIICPNGYTYNNTTQKCVPPTTPPPSVPNMRFAAVGDDSCTGDNDDTKALIKSKLTVSQDDVYLALGDFSYNDGDQSCWIESTQTLTGIYPNRIAPVLGNHDDEEDGESQDRTDIIDTFPLIPSEGYYTFTKRNIRFIMMDTQSDYTEGSDQHDFVVAALQQAAADPTIKWKVVCYHKPSMVSGSEYGPLTDLRNLYHPLFDQYKVDLILSGHNHNYMRTKPIRHTSSNPSSPTIVSNQAAGNYINIDGRIYATVGTGGRSSHPEFSGNIESYVGDRHSPEPYGVLFGTLQDNGNQIHFQFIGTDNVVLDDFILSKPGASTPPPVTCPTSFHWDETEGRCVVSPQTCPTGYTWSPSQNRCISNTGTPPPPTQPVDPMAGVEWYYDATATLNTPQTITLGSYDSVAGILLASTYADPTSNFTIADGWLTMPGAGAGAILGSANTRLGIDYWKLSRFATDERVGRNTAFTFTFRYNGNISIGIMDGNEYPTGILSPAKVFGGFALSLFGPDAAPDSGFLDGVGSRVNYYYNPSTGLFGQDTQIHSSYPGGRGLEIGKDYKVFGTYLTDRNNNRVVVNVWMDFGDGDGWVKVLTNRIYSSSNWAPASTPTGFDDTDEINTGPTALRRHRVVIRNNNSGVSPPRPSLMVKGIKVGTLPYFNDVTNPPGGGTDPPTQPPAGMTLDSRGIGWIHATGQQGVIAQTRDDPGDYRWSGNVSNVDGGYEVTSIFSFDGVSSDGHFALKHWGPNHSGNCGHEEDGSCCCWYDTGIRSNGNIQLQIERPHPNNDDFSAPTTMSNIGMGMDGNTIGLKWVVYPINGPGGTADDGGIKLKMWVDTSGLDSNGRPKNQWRLVYDIIDNGQILGDYDASGFEHDLENRVSDTDNVESYGGGLHWRKIVW